jgi:hypothetical protein
MAVNVASIDLEGSEGKMMSGVFRWKASHVLRSLPSWTKITNGEKGKKRRPYSYTGWAEFFLSKCQELDEELGPQLLGYVHSDLSIIDCLSFPLSVIYAGIQTKVLPLETELDYLNMVCVGCSGKAEERVLRQTECWEELALAYPRIKKLNLYLVGPEMSKTEAGVKGTTSGNNKVSGHWTPNAFSANTFRGTSNEFFKENKQMLPSLGSAAATSSSNTIVVGLNAGYGNFENPGVSKYDLLCSWFPDLSFLTTFPTLPCIFTCANDYADCRGESLVMAELLGARFISVPVKNEFTCASTFIPPNVEISGGTVPEYSCGNSYFYAVQGSVPDKSKSFVRRLPPECRAHSPAAGRYTTMDALIKSKAAGNGWMARLKQNMHSGYQSPLVMHRTAAPGAAPAPAPAVPVQAPAAVPVPKADWRLEQKYVEADGTVVVTIQLPMEVQVGDIDAFITNQGEEVCVTRADNREEMLTAPVKLARSCEAQSARAKYSKKKHRLTVTAAATV